MISYKDREQIRAYTDNIEPPYYGEPDKEKQTCMICGEEIKNGHICKDCKSNVIYVLKLVAHENAIDKYEPLQENDVENLASMMCDAFQEFWKMGINTVAEINEVLVQVFDW